MVMIEEISPTKAYFRLSTRSCQTRNRPRLYLIVVKGDLTNI
ncbi:hypothetical protein PO124_10770 [Bacillus licheniformis]|nr:hypothetical protein [Bacillus licheniformis]